MACHIGRVRSRRAEWPKVAIRTTEQFLSGNGIAGSDGRIRNVNRLLENLLGFSAAELAGEPVELLLPTHLRERHVAHRTRYTLAPAPRPMGVGVELAARHKEEAMLKELLIEGVLSIQSGDNPRTIEEKLKSFLPPGTRAALDKRKEAA